jgi:hypothetical protein
VGIVPVFSEVDRTVYRYERQTAVSAFTGRKESYLSIKKGGLYNV